MVYLVNSSADPWLIRSNISTKNTTHQPHQSLYSKQSLFKNCFWSTGFSDINVFRIWNDNNSNTYLQYYGMATLNLFLTFCEWNVLSGLIWGKINKIKWFKIVRQNSNNNF